VIRHTARTATALAAVLVATLIFVVSIQFVTQSKAKAFLEEANSLRIGTSTFDAAKKLEATYHGQELIGGIYPRECSPRNCHVRFLFTNNWLARLHLEPPTGFGTILHIENGLITSRITAYSAETGNHSFTLAADESSRSSNTEDFCVVFSRADLSGRPRKIQIRIGPKASQSQRALVYSFDLSCLAKLGTCGDPARILPIISQQDIAICSERPTTNVPQ
jgi:hypothetical protein